MFKVEYTVIHNRGASKRTAFSRSPKKAVRAAVNAAWEAYDRSGATNWADCWMTIRNPYGKIVFNDWGRFY